jgi:hypothetical protein
VCDAPVFLGRYAAHAGCSKEDVAVARSLPLVLLAVLSWSRASRAADPAEDASPPHPAPRLAIAALGGYAFLHRSASDPSSRDAATLGAQLRVHPTRSPHGFSASFLHAEGVFGPVVSILDAAYSYRFLGGHRLGGASRAAYLDAGPTLAWVWGAPPAADHRVLGARVSVAFDGHLGPLLVGVTLGYHGGVPLGGARDAWEGAVTSLLRVGFAFDL